MTTYSIEKLGSDYVVKVDDQQVMKVGSRRRAAQLVVNASELLDEAPLAPQAAKTEVETADDAPAMAGDEEQGAGTARSIARDGSEVA